METTSITQGMFPIDIDAPFVRETLLDNPMFHNAVANALVRCATDLVKQPTGMSAIIPVIQNARSVNEADAQAILQENLYALIKRPMEYAVSFSRVAIASIENNDNLASWTNFVSYVQTHFALIVATMRA